MNYSFVCDTELFRGVSENEAEKMFSCQQFRKAEYRKGEVICRSGTVVTEVGLVLTGSVRVESVNLWGDKNIFSIVGAGEVFAEAYACLPDQTLLVDVVANEGCTVLMMRRDRLLTPCETPCLCHSRLIKNLLFIGARQNIAMQQRMLDTSSKTIRGRLTSYLSREAVKQSSNTITIPFNRQQFADYLGIDRSALSNELGKMKREGLLDFRKNRFTIL